VRFLVCNSACTLRGPACISKAPALDTAQHSLFGPLFPHRQAQTSASSSRGQTLAPGEANSSALAAVRLIQRLADDCRGLAPASHAFNAHRTFTSACLPSPDSTTPALGPCEPSLQVHPFLTFTFHPVKAPLPRSQLLRPHAQPFRHRFMSPF